MLEADTHTFDAALEASRVDGMPMLCHVEKLVHPTVNPKEDQ